MAKRETATRKFRIELTNTKQVTVGVAGEFIHQKAVAAARHFAEVRTNEWVRIYRIRPGKAGVCTNEWFKGVQVR